MNEPSCYRVPNNLTFNDLITANRPKSFQNFSKFDIELSDFHKMTLTMKSHSKNKKPDP